MKTQKLHNKDLDSEFKGKKVILSCRSSFEERCFFALNAFKKVKPEKLTIFQSNNPSKESIEVIDSCLNSYKDIASYETISKDNPIDIYTAIFKCMSELFEHNSDASHLIDISSFKREELLILLSVLNQINNRSIDCRLLYTEAKDMSQNWLSRNTINIRTVLGFSGEPYQSKKTCLIVMVGHEFERAKDIIDEYEPSRLLIGHASKNEAINEKLYDRNKAFFKEIRSYYGSGCEEFEFSALCPDKVMNKLTELCSDHSYNYVIAPLNNKLSCIGVGNFAIKNKNVQICYGQMSDYNRTEYSSPGEYIHIMSNILD